ncbi:MAG: zinc-binding dehydrogenase [Rhodopseudomonas sp.]|nr:zinc-binding dehydrogenase [Rhodopseudomonas sp.]
MRAVIVDPPGGPDALQVVMRPVPKPAAGEVLIKVASAGINGADLSQREGKYNIPPGTPDILGLEVAGEIVALGDGVTGWNIGDPVCALLIGGGYADYCAAPAVQCLPVPKGLTIEQAGALPEVAMTVWSNVFEIGGLKAGERLLVHGGSSGIGTMAIQLARHLGARVIATAGSADKAKACVALGAERAINYKTEDFVEAARQWSGGAGVDVILDMVGGDYIQRGLECLAPGGRLVMLALKQGRKVEIDAGLIQGLNLSLTGSRLRPRPVAEKGRLVAAVRKAVWPLIERGDVRPVIDSTFPLDQVADGHRRMESGAHIGKVLLIS